MSFERVVLEDDPDFDVRKEYEDELDYYYRTHPEDRGYIPQKNARDAVVSVVDGARNALVEVVKFRDQLYGYDKDSKGPGVHLKPVEEMDFLPRGMAVEPPMGDLGGLGGFPPSANPFGFYRDEKPIIIYKEVCHRKKSGKKQSKHTKRKPRAEGNTVPQDPFGITKMRKPRF